MAQIFPIDFEEKLTMAQNDYILFSDSEDGNKIKKAQYKNLKWEPWTPWTPWTPWKDWEDWAAATISVWTTTTWAAGSSASVTNSWTSSAAVLDFTIPQWAKWEPWEDGQDWADGAAATITVWTTTTLPAWSSATVTNVWTSKDAILNFWIPKGDSWSGSWDVNWPASSTDWDLAIFDWATGKLIKDSWVSLADYQEKLTAGTNISIQNNTISATDTTYSAGTGLSLTWTTFANTWVTSVNNQTWAVTVSEFTASAWGTKVFDYPTTSVEDIVTWCNGWWTAILMKSDWPYVVSKVGTSYITSVRDNSWDWWTFGTWSVYVDMLTYNNNTYALISSNDVVTYNHFHPWGTATTGYVLTKTANGYEWSAPTEPTVVSGDTWVTYTIKVSNSDPTSWTANNIITLVP